MRSLILTLSLVGGLAANAAECGDSWKSIRSKASLIIYCPNGYGALLIGDYWYKYYDGQLIDLSNEWQMPTCGRQSLTSNLCEEQ